jgi:hypothetical protein
MWVAAGLVIGLGASQAMACPDWELAPSFGKIDLKQNFLPDPFRRDIRAGGQFDLSNCLDGAVGWAAAAPDFDLYYHTNGTNTLTITVQANTDTLLLINDPAGEWWFDDDSGGGDNPSISLPKAADGLYDIWIGTYDRASGRAGTLIITELD